MDEAITADTRYEDFLRVFARDREQLFAYVFSLLPHRADAEDVFQRCSLLLWRKFAEFDRDREFLPWACGVAFYEVRNFLRSVERDRLQFSAELIDQLAESRLESLGRAGDRLSALRDCLEQLQVADRELISVFYGSSERLNAFAQASGQALQTLYNRLSRIRQALLRCVDRRLALEGSQA